MPAFRPLLVLLAVLGTVSMGATPPDGGVAAPEGQVGFGARTVGGTGGRLMEVHDAKELRSAVTAKGARIVQITGSGVWDLGAVPLEVKEPNLTLIGDPDVTVRGGMLKILTSEVIVDGYRAALGDRGMSAKIAADADPITLNGLSGKDVHHVVIRRSTLIWGPDMGGLSILGNVHDVTVQDNILGEGLFQSAHPEARGSKGHSYALSIFRLHPDERSPARITITRNLLTRSNGRMPVISQAVEIDVINNVMYDWGERAPEGNPRGLNLVANYLRPGPDTRELQVWSPRDHKGDPGIFSASVFVAGNILEGATDSPLGGPDKVYRSSPAHDYSVTPMTAADTLDFVSANAGAGGALEESIVNDMVARRGGYFNGVGYPAPNPTW